jgi:hypothetical protein
MWSVALLALLPQAGAVEGLSWAWEDGVSRRYMMRAHVETPEYVTLTTENNLEPVVGKFTVALVTTCTKTDDIGKKAHEITCEIDDATLLVDPIPSFKGRTFPMLKEWTTDLKDNVVVTFIQTHEGKIRSINLRGVSGRNRRTQLKYEVMRQMVERAFSVFDMHLPKKGVDVSGAWTQKDGLPMRLMSASGTLGGVDITYRTIAEQGDAVLIAMEGAGTLISGELEETVARSSYKMDVVGSIRFDVKTHELVEAQFVADGVPTGSSGRSEGVVGQTYNQEVFAQLIPEGTDAPELPKSDEM